MSAILWTDYGVGEHRTPCPECGRGARDKTLGVTIVADGSGVAHCFRCGLVERYRPEHGSREARPAKPLIKGKRTSGASDTLTNVGRELWDACGALSGVAVAYLEARCCRIPPSEGDLRFHPALKHPTGHVGPALVALVTHAVTGKPMTLHRTWVRPDGRKADVEPPRLLLGGHRKQGGVIRLWPDECVTYGLAVAEGVETALSLAWGFTPVWACIDAGNLAAFPSLFGIESLVIACDNDAAGRAASRACAVRWADAGAQTCVTRQTANDLNDVLTGVTKC
ncbi:DUF7146 domain-containing protein [Paraburkholderia bannensis]|uniref:DUF7146 domain-containing protein n=1 Tax=Paraburkholderia bannensis TaxID=765414 RepID=UPI002AB11D0F|nr:toprim domain-containing protein [Paraburkholderia bannensis]